jgi:uncharacterized protein YqcC (DUF446 family)
VTHPLAPSDQDRYAQAVALAERIEAELKRIGGWAEPQPEKAFDFERAFGRDTFYQWLQFALLERIRGIVRERGEFPGHSQVGVYAVGELDGAWEADELIRLLIELDDLVESGGAIAMPRSTTAHSSASPGPRHRWRRRCRRPRRSRKRIAIRC